MNLIANVLVKRCSETNDRLTDHSPMLDALCWPCSTPVNDFFVSCFGSFADSFFFVVFFFFANPFRLFNRPVDVNVLPMRTFFITGESNTWSRHWANFNDRFVRLYSFCEFFRLNILNDTSKSHYSADVRQTCTRNAYVIFFQRISWAYKKIHTFDYSMSVLTLYLTSKFFFFRLDVRFEFLFEYRRLCLGWSNQLE